MTAKASSSDLKDQASFHTAHLVKYNGGMFPTRSSLQMVMPSTRTLISYSHIIRKSTQIRGRPSACFPSYHASQAAFTRQKANDPNSLVPITRAIPYTLYSAGSFIQNCQSIQQNSRSVPLRTLPPN